MENGGIEKGKGTLTGCPDPFPSDGRYDTDHRPSYEHAYAYRRRYVARPVSADVDARVGNQGRHREREQAPASEEHRNHRGEREHVGHMAGGKRFASRICVFGCGADF